MNHGRLIVDLDALADNYATLKARAAGDVAAVVKANAYGLGALPVARRLAAEGCRQFFVATESEGVALRPALPKDADIFVFSGEAQAPGLIAVANHAAQLGPSPVALHVDTGMQRLGFPWDAVPAAAEKVRLLISHLACAETPDHPFNAEQIRRFEAVAERFPGVPTSLANSAGILNGVAGLGRAGIGLYGGNPWADRPNPMRPVATFEGQVLQVRSVRTGETVGYGAGRALDRDAEVAVVGVGYADGVRRSLSNRGAAAFAGKRLPIIGAVSMDLTHLDATGTGLARGDWVEFCGPNLSVDEMARRADTIAYEILTGIGNRVERRYLP